MMKLCQGMLTENIADCFDISIGLASDIITTWVKAASAVLEPLICGPGREVMYKTLSNQVKSMPEIHSILDCTEVFIETPKNLGLLRITLSDYKYHNTAKLLLRVALKSSIIFISKGCGGFISDKELANCSDYLDLVLMSSIQIGGIRTYLPPGVLWPWGYYYIFPPGVFWAWRY